MRATVLPLIAALLLPGAGGAQDRSVVVEGTYTGDLFANLAGGRERGVDYLDDIDVTASFDLGRLLGWSGTRLFLYGLGNQGGHPSALVGDVQGVDNIEAPDAWQLYEAWVQHVRSNGRLSVLAGLYDLNTEFDLIRTAALFINSSQGMGPEFSSSGRNGPSIFPHTSLGLRVRWLPTTALYVEGAVLDGVPGDPANPRGTHVRLSRSDGALVAVEAGLYVGRGREETEAPVPRRRVSRLGVPAYDARVAVGLWGYTAAQPTFEDPATRARGRGAYLLGEWAVSRASPDAGGLSLFGRVGAARDAVDRFSGYLGAGAVYTRPFPGRSDDRLGAALAHARNGEPWRRARARAGRPAEGAETTLELTYLATLSARLSLQGDLQYVIDPGTDPALENATVAGVRLVVAF